MGEVITIDSSDDDDNEVVPAVKGAVSTLDKSRDVGSQDTIDIQSASSDDDSADSIWDKGGFTSISSSKECWAALSKDIHLLSNVEDETNANDEYENIEALIGDWKVMLLMDHREFGQAKGKIDFLKVVENKINRQFGGVHCEQVHLPAADYLYVARLYSDNGNVIDERVLDLVIERKDVNDLQACLTTDGKKYEPLSFFEAQMYKLQHCGIAKKLFIMEGDEDNPSYFSMYSANTGITSLMEQEKRLKRVKTVRIQVRNRHSNEKSAYLWIVSCDLNDFSLFL
jgi:ERCC4-type nuclease